MTTSHQFTTGEHPELRRFAYRHYARALRWGMIKRGETCEECGRAGRLHGHHASYARPMSVTWLCPACHARTHWGTAN